MRLVMPDQFDAQAAVFAGPGAVRERAEELAPLLGHRFPPSPAAVAVRWRLAPAAMFPRRAFEVWRRPAVRQLGAFPDVNTDLDARRVDAGLGAVSLTDRRPLFLVCGRAFPRSGGLTVHALGRTLQRIVGRSRRFDREGDFCLRGAGVCGLEVEGAGHLALEGGIGMRDYALVDDWELIDRVGLPIVPAEVPEEVYRAEGHGPPGSPLPGRKAAFVRLEIGRLLFGKPPAPPGFSPPPWPAPISEKVLDDLRAGDRGLVTLLLKTLAGREPGVFLAPDERRTRIENLSGLPTEGLENVTAAVSPEAAALIAAATDGVAALALGFGTTDFVSGEPVGPSVTWPPPFDYMVTFRPDVLRFPTGFDLGLFGGDEIEYAALATPVTWPLPPPDGLLVEERKTQRPRVLDGSGTEDLRLGWRAIPPEQFAGGVATLASEAGAPPKTLNPPRAGGGFAPLVPATRVRSDPAEPPEEKTVLTLPGRPLPFAGERADEYFVGRLDVFGRWSDWAVAPHLARSLPPGRPSLISVQFEPTEGGIDLVARTVRGQVTIEFGWHWEDRSPLEIELTGLFVTSPRDLPRFDRPRLDPDDPTPIPDPAPVGFPGNPGGPAGTAIRAVWPRPAADACPVQETPPQIAGGNPLVTVAPVVDAPPDAGGLPVAGAFRRYRTTVQDVQVPFDAVERWTLGVYARAKECVNGQFGPHVGPRTTTIPNPFRPAAPTLSADLQWAALPDATGTARFDLRFPAVSRAAGYAAYLATEQAVHAATAAGPLPPGADPLPPTDGNVRERANALLLLAGQPTSQAAFSRVNVDLLEEPKFELRLPGNSENLFVVTGASVSWQQMESERSSFTIVGVPRSSAPPTPRLFANFMPGADSAPGEVTVTIETVGPPVADLLLFRSASRTNASVVGRMGPPVAALSAASITAESVDAASGTRRFTASDIPAGGGDGGGAWFYRAVAVGVSDPERGLIGERSPASPVAEILLRPTRIPRIGDVRRLAVPGPSVPGPLLHELRWFIDEDFGPGVPGSFLLRLAPLAPNEGEEPGAVSIRTSLAEIPAAGNDPSPTVGGLVRLARDPAAGWEFLAWAPADAPAFLLRLEAPWEKTAEAIVPAQAEPPLAEPEPPDLSGLRVRVQPLDLLRRRLRVAFVSSAPAGRSREEPHELAIGLRRDRVPTFTHVPLPDVPVGADSGSALFRDAVPDAGGRFQYRFTLVERAAPSLFLRPVEEVIVRITDPDGLQTELRANVP